MVNKVNIKPAPNQHVSIAVLSMLMLAYILKHCCAKLQPLRALCMAVAGFVKESYSYSSTTCLTKLCLELKQLNKECCSRTTENYLNTFFIIDSFL